MLALTNPDWWFIPDPFDLNAILNLGTSIALSTLFVIVFVRGLFPLLTYVPEAAAMKSLGLVRVATGEHGWSSLTKTSSRAEDIDTINVVCITGKYLFREERMPTGEHTPLHEIAKDEKINVIALMPKSDTTHPLVRARWDSYPEVWRESHGIATIEEYVHQIDKGKEWLLARPGNKVYEFESFCGWRLVKYADEVIVQPYFPNFQKGWSFASPAVVYERTSDATVSFYHVYDDIIRNLQDEAIEVKASEET